MALRVRARRNGRPGAGTGSLLRGPRGSEQGVAPGGPGAAYRPAAVARLRDSGRGRFGRLCAARARGARGEAILSRTWAECESAGQFQKLKLLWTDDRG
jgi:hypothetical protein